jgi:hypothetical protein
MGVKIVTLSERTEIERVSESSAEDNRVTESMTMR